MSDLLWLVGGAILAMAGGYLGWHFVGFIQDKAKKRRGQ